MAESLGFDSIWLMDHFMAHAGEADGPCLEASPLLAALALKTARVQVGVLVYGNTHRHPAVLAKGMVTADHLSGGRFPVTAHGQQAAARVARDLIPALREEFAGDVG